MGIQRKLAAALAVLLATTISACSTQQPSPVAATRTSVEGQVDTDLTLSQQNAIRFAHDYIDMWATSRTGLIEILELEHFTHEEATFAADSLNINWDKQAVRAARDYLEYGAFSRQGLIEQLESDGFTPQQAKYGAVAAGY